jgi:acyl-CoA synthetase (AMP-forming)/AMP-acid ligase II
MVDYKAWRQKVAAWTVLFETHPAQRWALFDESAVEFSAIFLALLHAGKSIVLPGNLLPETQVQVASRVDACVGGFNRKYISKSLYTHFEQEKSFDESVYRTFEDLDSEATVSIFTSGSTGEPETINKSFGQLSREVSTLQTCWAEALGRSQTITTVSHQHIYGLLFNILWPLAGSRPFQDSLSPYSEDIYRDIMRSNKAVLVSSPSHLGRLQSSINWTDVSEKISLIFSSTAPLEYATATRVRDALGQLPIEVFGSSETGGVGWRQQVSAIERWRPLPGVHLRSNDEKRLLLQSPHLPNMEWQLCDDLIDLHANDQFMLLGRADTIAKIEGKRVSLTEIENALLSHPLVYQVRVTTNQTQPRRRDRTFAVVGLNHEGINQLQESGKLAMNRQLVTHLEQRFESVAIPKKFRYVSHLPVNQQGKTTLKMLQGLFGDDAVKMKLPSIVLYQQRSDIQWGISLIPQVSLVFFSGHFPDQAVLPGVAMVFWTEYYSRLLFGIASPFKSLKRVKFQQIVRPNLKLLATLTFDSDKNVVTYSFDSTLGPHASGRMTFGS